MYGKTITLTLLALLPLAACASTSKGIEEEESYIRTEDGSLLHFRRLNGGPDVLLVPGESWLSPDMNRLAAGRTVIFYDLRNRGRSAPARTARIEQDLEDLENVRSWFDLERFSLLGFDYQAALAAKYAAQHPGRVEKLVLISPLPPRKKPHMDIYNRVFNDRVDDESFSNLRKLRMKKADILQPGTWAEAYAETVLSGWVQDKSSIDRMKASPLVEPNVDPEPLHRQYRGLLDALGEWDWREELSSVPVPALIVYGESDPMPQKGHEEWTASLGQATSTVIPASGRLPWIERPKDFYSAVEAFLE